MPLPYLKAHLRTDNGEYLDIGNYGVDVRHPQFAGGAVPHWVGDSTRAFQLAIAYARTYGLPLLVYGHFKVSEEMNWHQLTVLGRPGTLNTDDTQSFFYNASERSSILAGPGCSRLVKIGPATSAADGTGNQRIHDLTLRADADTTAGCVLIGSDHGFLDYDVDLHLLGPSGLERSKTFYGFKGYMANDPAEGFYYNRLRLNAKHLCDGIHLDSAAASNGPWANRFHFQAWACVRGVTVLKSEENVFEVLEINDFLDDYSPTALTEWGSKVVGNANQIQKLSQEGDPGKPHHLFSISTQILDWRNPSRGSIQLLDDVGAVASMERHWQHVTIGADNGTRLMADLGQANRAANLVTNGHFSQGIDDNGSAADAQSVYNDWSVVKQEATATMRVISWGLTGSNYLTYGNAVDIRLTNGVAGNFYGLEQDLLARHVARNISKFREGTIAVIVKGGTGTYSLRVRYNVNGVVTTKDFACVSGLFTDKLAVPAGEFQILLMDPVDLGAVSTAFKVSVGILSNGSASEQRLTIDSVLVIPGLFNEYAMRALIEPGHMEALRARSLGSALYPMAGCYLDKTISTAGAVTINKPAGRIRVANGSTSTVVTNNLVTANSVIVLTPASSMGAATNLRAIAGAGSFTVTVTTDPGVNVDVNFAIVG